MLMTKLEYIFLDPCGFAFIFYPPKDPKQIVQLIGYHTSGAPNENIVQNHLNIALLIVFQYLNGRYRHVFTPLKFSICSDFLAESLVIRKNLPLRKFQPEKRLPKILGDLFRLKIR